MVDEMLTYVLVGNAASLARFGMDEPGAARGHLVQMAEAKVASVIASGVVTDKLSEALKRAGAS